MDSNKAGYILKKGIYSEFSSIYIPIPIKEIERVYVGDYLLLIEQKSQQQQIVEIIEVDDEDNTALMSPIDRAQDAYLMLDMIGDDSSAPLGYQSGLRIMYIFKLSHKSENN